MRFAVIDTETSGLLDDPDAWVVEVGVALFDTDDARPVVAVDDAIVTCGGDVPEGSDPANRAQVMTCVPYLTWSSLVRPPVLTEEGKRIIRMVSGIDPEEILAAPLPAVVLEELVSVIGGLGVRAYNWAFDHPMMIRSFGSFPWSGEPIAWGEDAVTGEPSTWREAPACVMEAFTVRYRPFTKMHEDGRPMFVRLIAAARLVGVFEEDSMDALHRAAYDAALAGRIAVAIDCGARAVDVQVDAVAAERDAVVVLPDCDLVEIGAARRGESEVGSIGVAFEAAPTWPDAPDVEV